MSIEAICFQQPIVPIVDGNGIPLASGSVTFNEAGIPVAINVYSDIGLSVALPNPVPLNASGYTSTSTSGSPTAVYLQQQPYDVTLKDVNGNTIWGPVTIPGSQWPGSIQGQVVIAPPATTNGYANRFTTTIDKASSGTHALFAGSYFDPTTIGAGGSTLTESATVYIAGAPTGGTSFFALHVAAGTTRFDGPVFISGVQVQPGLDLQCQGRLTLTSGTPVTTGDVTGATTIYFTPYAGDIIALYDGTANWIPTAFIETAFPLGTLSSGLPYDVFAFNNSGTMNLELAAWTNGTTRAVNLTTQNGILVKTGATTRRYLGTFFTTSSTTTADARQTRYLFNYYNRVPRELKQFETTGSWTYGSPTFREANGRTGVNVVTVMVGWPEDPVDVSVMASFVNASSANAPVVGIGLDGTSALASDQIVGVPYQAAAGGGVATSRYLGYPGVGAHTWYWIEAAINTGTAVSFYSAFATNMDAVTNPAGPQSGLLGWCRA